jgi:hypothetical protein
MPIHFKSSIIPEEGRGKRLHATKLYEAHSRKTDKKSKGTGYENIRHTPIFTLTIIDAIAA